MFSLEDSLKSIEYFSQIVNNYPDDDIAQVAADHIELIGGGGLRKGAVGQSDNGLNPKEYSLSNNYPNPFNPATKIEFALPEPGLTKLIIYDLLGKEIARLIDRQMEAGSHRITWNASKYASGIYFYRLTTGKYSETKKMLLLK